jgi:hypothetical protein
MSNAEMLPPSRWCARSEKLDPNVTNCRIDMLDPSCILEKIE